MDGNVCLLVGWSVDPPLWSEPKYLNSYWIVLKFGVDFHGPQKKSPLTFCGSNMRLKCHDRPPEDEL